MPVVIAGAGGRLGRLLQPVWPGPAPLWTSRRESPGCLTWDLARPAPAALRVRLQDARWARPGGVLLSLAGAAPGAGPAQSNCSTAELALNRAADLGLDHVILLSSLAVYGPTPSPAPEHQPLRPINAYGHAKAQMEDRALARSGVTVLRLGNVFGADGLGRALAVAGNAPAHPLALDRTGPRGPLRSWIGPVSLARVLAVLLARAPDLPAVLNLAQPGVLGMADILRAARARWLWRLPDPQALPRALMATDRLQTLLPGLLAPAQAPQLVAEARIGGAFAPRAFGEKGGADA